MKIHKLFSSRMNFRLHSNALNVFLFLAFCASSTVASAKTVATPTFSPAAGTYTSPQTVTIKDTTSGATIYYTTNGTTPTTSSTQYSSPINISVTETLKAIATHSGDTNSAVKSGTYTISSVAATPTFSPGAGSYGSVQTVTISDTTPGASIYYTLNGTAPTTSSAPYLDPVYITNTETLEAIAVASGYTNSAVKSAAYTIPAGTPARSFPSTSSTLLEFNDQVPLGSLSAAQIQFLATKYAGSQKQLASEATSLRAYNSNYLVLHYRLSEHLGYGQCTNATPPVPTETNYLTIIDGNNWVEEWAWPGNPAPAADTSWFYQCDGTYCTPSGSVVYDCGDQHWLMNITNVGWENYYSQQVIKALYDNDDDGVFADSFSVPNYLGSTIWTPNLAALDMSAEDTWATNMYSFTTYMRAQLNGNWLWIPNLGPYVTTRDPSNYTTVDGAMIEDFAEYGDENLPGTSRLGDPDESRSNARQPQQDTAFSVVSQLGVERHLRTSFPHRERSADAGRVHVPEYPNRVRRSELVAGVFDFQPTRSAHSSAAQAPLPTISGFAQTSGNGVTYYQRDFVNGMVLVNPTGNDTGTIAAWVPGRTTWLPAIRAVAPYLQMGLLLVRCHARP